MLQWNCSLISALIAEIQEQFEWTLIVAESGSSVSYPEGCTAPMYDTNQLHAAVVELVDNAEIK